MKPFDLSAALAGHPVCTRDGRPVTQLVKFNLGTYQIVAGALGGHVHHWKLDGMFNNYSTGSGSDLFMVPVKKTGWVARYNKAYVSGVYESESDALLKAPEALSYHEISWEE